MSAGSTPENNQPQKGLSNKIAVFAVIAASALFAVALWSRTQPLEQSLDSTAAPVSAKTAAIRPEVLDGLTGAPIGGASVVIPETDERYSTDESGQTPVIELSGSVPSGALTKPWIETCLLIYKEGYVPYALFGAQALPNQHREGPRVYLFPESSVQSDQPFSVTEGPPRSWVNALIEQYRPQGS